MAKGSIGRTILGGKPATLIALDGGGVLRRWERPGLRLAPSPTSRSCAARALRRRASRSRRLFCVGGRDSKDFYAIAQER